MIIVIIIILDFNPWYLYYPGYQFKKIVIIIIIKYTQTYTAKIYTNMQKI